jgi:hypothetical protein
VTHHRRARALAVLAAAAALSCGHAAPPPRRAIHATLPAPFALQLVVPWKAGSRVARLRLDDAARPYLVTTDSFIPLAHLPSGADAKPFRIGGAATLTDATWADGGVILLVVGTQLGTVDEHGFRAIADLPAPGMRVVASGPDRCWLFAPAAGEGRLYLYDRAGTVTEVLRAPSAIHAAAGTPAHAYAAIDTSIVRITERGVELVLDGGQPILALAAARDHGVFFSTATGTFYLSDQRAIARLAAAGASAIEARGDDVYFVFDGLGIVRGAPVSAFASR